MNNGSKTLTTFHTGQQWFVTKAELNPERCRTSQHDSAAIFIYTRLRNLRVARMTEPDHKSTVRLLLNVYVIDAELL
jgi:hypothetical protein